MDSYTPSKEIIASHLQQINTVVTFDQALYCKAKELIWLNPEECKDVIVCLSCFHIALKILQAIGQYLDGSGLTDMWIEAGLYNECTAFKILEGKQWNCAI